MVPGLYIEKGWVHESIDYSFTPPPEDKLAEPEGEEEEDGESAATHDSQGKYKLTTMFFLFDQILKSSLHPISTFLFCWVNSFQMTDYSSCAGAEKDDGSIDGAISEGAQQGAAADVCIETTVPKLGQNLW